MGGSERTALRGTQVQSAAQRNGPPPTAVVHVDLDGARAIYHRHGWLYPYADDPLFTTGLKNLLDFLDRNHLRATLFAIASDVDEAEKRELLAEAVRRGHEIASHSLTHPRFARLTREEKRTEIAESRERLEARLATSIRGFRAPCYEVDRDCLELLEAYGYQYDSSAFPTSSIARRLSVVTNRLPACGSPWNSDDALAEKIGSATSAAMASSARSRRWSTFLWESAVIWWPKMRSMAVNLALQKSGSSAGICTWG